MGGERGRAEEAHQHGGSEEQPVLEEIGARNRPADMDDLPDHGMVVAEAGKDMKAPEAAVEMDIARDRQELQPAHDRAREADAGHAEPRHAEAAIDEEIVGERRNGE